MGSGALVTVFVLLGITLLATAIVSSVIFLRPKTTGGLSLLRPGVQSTTTSKNKGAFYKTRIKIADENVYSLKLVTYVFNKQPVETVFNETVRLEFTGEKKVTIELPALKGTTIPFSIDVNTPTQVLYSTLESEYQYNVYKKNNLKQFSDVINVKKNVPHAVFQILAKHPIEGTFNMTVQMPQWSIVAEEAIDTCRDYPCEWKYSNYNWTKSSLWFITVNEGNVIAKIESKNYYTFVLLTNHLFTLVLCVFFFHVFVRYF